MRRILLDNILSDMKLARPLYSADGVILLNAGLELEKSIVDRLRELDVTYIYIEDAITADVDVPDIISEKVRLEAVMAVKTLMEGVIDGGKVDASKANKIVSALVAELCRNKGVIVNFLDMRSRGDYLFNHSVNVCILAVLTGINLGYDEFQLRDLGIGALLHDIGKVRVSAEILTKKHRLNAVELDEMRQHCKQGFDILRKSTDVSHTAAYCALQHHEHYDGGGYPQNLKGGEIHKFAQIVALADVYDALTSDSYYRQAMPEYEALAFIGKEAGTYFEPGLVEHFTNNIAVYPIGTVVRLSNGAVGVVVDFSKESKSKPVVRLTVDKNKQPLRKLMEVDLSKSSQFYIADVMER